MLASADTKWQKEGMPRHLRVLYPGAIYHVTVRGNGRQAIFKDDADRERLLERLAESVESYGVRVYLYCLMSNHMHLVLETPGANLSRFMQSLLTGYTVYYNLRNKTCGHLFQGRYGAKLVAGDEYLLRLSRYVHLNPVYVGASKGLDLKARIKALRNYYWSSYPGYIGGIRRKGFVEYGPVLAQMGGRGQAQSYRRYVESALAETDDEFRKILEKGRGIGDEDFCARIRDAWQDLATKAARMDDVEFRREAPRLTGRVVLETVARRTGVEMAELRRRRRKSIIRPLAALMLLKYAGMRNRAAAELLGLQSGEAVGLQARRAQQTCNKNDVRVRAAIESDLQGQMAVAK